MKMQRYAMTLATLLALATAGLQASPPPSAPTIDKALLEQSPQILQKLSERGYENVGVLPFVVQYGEGAQSYHGSRINNDLAGWLETALLRNAGQTPDVKVIYNAGKSAAKSLGKASARTVKGRQQLFNVSYELPAPKNARVRADAFVFGKLWVAKDYGKAGLAIYSFDSLNTDPQKILSTPVTFSHDLLSSMGQSFLVAQNGHVVLSRGLNDLGDVEFSEEGDLVSMNDRTSPIDLVQPGDDLTGFPVKLTVIYESRRQTLVPDPYGKHNFFTIPDPAEGERVTFEVENMRDETLAVAVAVNGVNTLYRQEGDPMKFSKWILAPRKKYRIAGWWLATDQKPLAIVGASEEESRRRYDEMDPEHVGTIGMWVYSKSSGLSEQLGSPMASRDNGSLYRLPADQRESVGSMEDFTQLLNLQASQSLDNLPKTSSRGLMIEGDEVSEDPLKVDAFGVGHLIGHMTVKYYSAAQATSGIDSFTN